MRKFLTAMGLLGSVTLLTPAVAGADQSDDDAPGKYPGHHAGESCTVEEEDDGKLVVDDEVLDDFDPDDEATHPEGYEDDADADGHRAGYTCEVPAPPPTTTAPPTPTTTVPNEPQECEGDKGEEGTVEEEEDGTFVCVCETPEGDTVVYEIENYTDVEDYNEPPPAAEPVSGTPSFTG